MIQYKWNINKMQKQKRKSQPLDRDIFFRWLHLHCFVHIYKILTQPKPIFAYPRFTLFKQINLPNLITSTEPPDNDPNQKQNQNNQRANNKAHHDNEQNSSNKHSQMHNQNKTKPTNKLAKKLLLSFIKQLIIGGIITIIFSSLNLIVPLMIKQFLHFMHEHHVDQNEIVTTELLIEGFVVLQFLRIVFGEHSKRLFLELAIKVESSLAVLIVKKSLTISEEARAKSQAEILQLQNIDLRLVFVMFQNLFIAVQVPFTIFVTIYLLYLQNYKYGLIGIYWFVIAFLIQRQLDSKMTHCNDTKLKLIEARSKINYHIIGKIRAAKLLGQHELLIQKNNDYFVAQNHDHQMFYNYVTLYDISLILLPIFVVVSIALYDYKETSQISVSQVYVLLSLLGISYTPMKNYRTLTLSLHDGLRSLNKIELFLRQPDQVTNNRLKLNFKNKQNQKYNKKDKKIKENSITKKQNQPPVENTQPSIIIRKNLRAKSRDEKLKPNIEIGSQINLYPGERLVVVGKVNSGVQTFFDSLIGEADITQGEIIINQRITYLNSNRFFRNTTVKQNIRFFNQQVTDERIESIYKLLNLDQDLELIGGLEGNMDDQYKYNSVQLHKISLARLLCSTAQIYVLDRVFQPLNSEDQMLLEQILRQKQSQGKVVILFNYPNNLFDDEDKVMIFQKGKTTKLSQYSEILVEDNQLFKKFYYVQTVEEEEKSQKQKTILSRLKSKLTQQLNSSISLKQRVRIQVEYGRPILTFGIHLWKQYKQSQHKNINNQSIRHYIMKFFSVVKFREFVYVFLIIAVAELMHIFIHFYFGHLEEEHGNDGYVNFKGLLVMEVVLTLGLAGIIWLEGQVASEIAMIQGNNLYNQALTSLGQNKLSWFQKQYSVKIANRFNHVIVSQRKDYQQLYIILHMFLNIYKNIVILVATIYFISQSRQSLIIMTLGIAATYLTVYFILRAVERKVVDHFENYKYKYVKVLEETISGAKLISIHGSSKSLIENAKKAYLEFASYKIAESYTAYGEEIFCDLVSLLIFAYVLNYGLQSKVTGNSKSIAEVGTMIHLLVGIFDVFKTIVKDSVNFETFFKINILPFIEIIKQKAPETISVEQMIDKSQQQFQKQILEKLVSLIDQKQISNKQEHKNEEQTSKQLLQLSRKINNSTQSTHSQILLSTRHMKPITKLFHHLIKFDIHFNNLILHESKYHEPVFEVYPLNIRIQQGEKVLFYESNEYLRNYLVYALTKNLPMFNNPEIMAYERTKAEILNKQKTILIGGRDICSIDKEQLDGIVQVLIDHDFYIQGTLQDNIAWKNFNFDPHESLFLANYLHIDRELPEIKKYGLNAKINKPKKELVKKITFLRILSMKPKIIIIKDIDQIIQNYFLIEEINKFLGAVTIIKISFDIEQAFDVERIIHTRNFSLIQDGIKDQMMKDPLSLAGNQLLNANIPGMLYTNRLTSFVQDAEKQR